MEGTSPRWARVEGTAKTCRAECDQGPCIRWPCHPLDHKTKDGVTFRLEPDDDEWRQRIGS